MREWGNRIRRIFALALTAVLLGSVADISVFAVSGVPSFSTVKIGGVDVSSASGITTLKFGEGEAVWDPANAVLTLENVSISQNNIAILTGTFEPVPVTVNLKGINEIDITQCVEGAALTTGDSVLTVNGEDGAELKIKGMSQSAEQNAIQGKSIQINSGAITAEVNGSAVFGGDEVNIAGGTLDLKSVYSAVYGISAVNIIGGRIAAESTASSAIYAVNGNVCISGNGTEVYAEAANGNAVYGLGPVNIEGGILQLESDYPAVYSASAVDITGGKITAISTRSSAVYTDGSSIRISGTGTEVDAAGYYCALFSGGQVEVSGAKVTGHSQENHVVYTAVGPITIGNQADVTLSSNYTMATGLFLNSEKPLTITDSAVDIATDGTGMYSKTDISITDSRIELDCPNGNGILAHNGKLSMGGEKGSIKCKSKSPLYGAEVEILGGYVDMVSSEGPAVSGMNGISVTGGEVHGKAVGTDDIRTNKPAAFYSSKGNVSFTGETTQVEAISEGFRAVYTDNGENGKIILDAKVSAKAGEGYEVFMACSNGTDNTSDPEAGIIIGQGYSAQGYCPVTTKWKETSQGSNQYFAYTVLAPYGTENLQEDYFQDLPGSADIVAAAPGVSAGQARLDFGSSPYGDEVPRAQAIEITNTGNTILTLVLPEPNHYTVTAATPDSGLTLVPGETADFTIQPKSGFTPGDYGETIAFSTDNEGAAAQVQAAFTVSQAELTVTGAAAQERKYNGTREVQITGVALEGIKDGEDVSVETAGLRGSISAPDAGTYHEVLLPPLSLTGADAGNYLLVQPQEAVPASPVVRIRKEDAEIVTGTEAYSKVYGDGPFALEASGSHTEADLQYTVAEGADIVSVDKGTVTIQKAGTAVITLSLPATGNYNAAPDKNITVKVEKKGGYKAEAVRRTYLYAKEYRDTVDLRAVLPSDCGFIIWGTPAVSGNVTYTEDPVIEDGKLIYTLNGGNIGDSGSITVDVTAENYGDFTATVHVELTDQIPVHLKTGTEVTLKNHTLTYGETLSRLEFNRAEFVDSDGNTVDGTLAWKESTYMPDAGAASVSWVFIPADMEYAPVEGTAEIMVKKAVPYIAQLPGAGAVTYGESLEASLLSGGTVQYGNGAGAAGTGAAGAVAVDGVFTWEDVSIKPAVADSGETEYTVIFTPSDRKNYDSVRVKVRLTVNKAQNAPNMPKSTMEVPGSCEKVGGAALPEGWQWSPACQDTPLEAGETVSAVAVYVGADKGSYENETAAIAVTRAACVHEPGEILYTGNGEKAPSCEEGGLGHRECTKCHKVTQSNIAVPALGHRYTDHVTRKPTAKREGVRTYTCSRCGHRYTEPIPKLADEENPQPAQEKQKKNEFTLNAGLKADLTGRKVHIQWGKVSGADGYDVYVQYCGRKMNNQSRNQVRGGQKTKITVKKVNGRKLDTKKNIRIFVEAFKMENGRKITLARSITAHMAGRNSKKYTNVKAIKVRKNSYRMKRGGTAAIKAETVLADKRRRELPDAHAERFRYASSNPKAATVSKNGKIKAVGKGSCTIYVYARNGCGKKIKVTVDE